MQKLWHKLLQAKQLQNQVENILLFVFDLKQNKPKPKGRIGKSLKRSWCNKRNLLSTLQLLYFNSCLTLTIKMPKLHTFGRNSFFKSFKKYKSVGNPRKY